MATREAVGRKLSLEGASPSCPQQCEWVRCLELRGRAGRVLSTCRILSKTPIPGGDRHRELSAEVGAQNRRHRLPCLSQGQPFPSVPMGLLGSRSCPFVVGCQERASGLYSFKEQARGG